MQMFLDFFPQDTWLKFLCPFLSGCIYNNSMFNICLESIQHTVIITFMEIFHICEKFISQSFFN